MSGGRCPQLIAEDWGQRDPSVMARMWQESVGSRGGDCGTRGQRLRRSMGWSWTLSPEGGQLLSWRCAKDPGGVQGAAGAGLHERE